MKEERERMRASLEELQGQHDSKVEENSVLQQRLEESEGELRKNLEEWVLGAEPGFLHPVEPEPSCLFSTTQPSKYLEGLLTLPFLLLILVKLWSW